MTSGINSKAFDPSALKMRFGPNPEDVVSIDIENLEVGGVPVWGPDGLAKELAAKLVDASGVSTSKTLHAEESGVHSLRGGRVLGVQFAMPEGPLKQAVDNALITDTRLKNPMSALKQYDRVLERVRPDDFISKMIIHNRAGLAMNHLVAQEQGKQRLDVELAEETRDRLQQSVDIAKSHGVGYGAPHYNLATLYSMMGMTEMGLEQLEKAIEADPLLFEELAQKDSDLKALAGPRFTELVEGELAERRVAVDDAVSGSPGATELLSRLAKTEAFKLKVGASNPIGPSFGIELQGDLFLTADGLRVKNSYSSETTEGSAYRQLSSQALSDLNFPALQAEIKRLGVDGGQYAFTMTSHKTQDD